MRKYSWIIFFLLLTCVVYAQDESVTITTYYPSPYGVYRELRANQMTIGSAYMKNAVSDGNLFVSGNVGVGTASPVITAPNGKITGNMDVNDIFLRGATPPRWVSQSFTCRPDVAKAYFVNGCTTCWRFCKAGDVMIGAQAIDNKYGRIGAIECAPLICQ